MGISNSNFGEAEQELQAVRSSSYCAWDADADIINIRKLDDPTSSSTTAQSPADLTQLYFSYLYEHLKATLVAKLSASVFESTPIDFILTVPAIWSLAAKQKTETAATRAGFKGSKKIHLVTEPVSPTVNILAIELIVAW
jgi:molecular chaperone DnaK (HSP70)